MEVDGEVRLCCQRPIFPVFLSHRRTIRFALLKPQPCLLSCQSASLPTQARMDDHLVYSLRDNGFLIRC